MKIIMCKMKQSLDEIKNNLDIAEEMFNELENIGIKKSKTKYKEIFEKNEQNIRELWKHFKYLNIRVIGAIEREDKKNFGEIMTKNSPDLIKTINYRSKKLNKC